MYEKEARIVLDYSTLSETHKELDDIEDVQKAEKRMQKHITDLKNTIQRIQVSHIREELLMSFGADVIEMLTWQMNKNRVVASFILRRLQDFSFSLS